jgi:hypothetical protein
MNKDRESLSRCEKLVLVLLIGVAPVYMLSWCKVVNYFKQDRWTVGSVMEEVHNVLELSL